MMLTSLIALPLIAAPFAQETRDAEAAGWIRVDLAEVDLASWGDPEPAVTRTLDTDLHRPRVILDSGAETILVTRLAGNMRVDRDLLADRAEAGVLLARAPLDEPLVGDLVLPSVTGCQSLRIDFTAPASALAPASEADRAAALVDQMRRLQDDELPGGAWFRHVVDRCEPLVDQSDLAERFGISRDLDAWADWRDRRARRDDYDTIGFLSGGQALAENLQLDRVLPVPAEGDEEAELVPLSEIRGITVREFDWSELVEDLEPELDPLADAVPADNYALFAPSIAALDEALTELESLGAPLAQAFEQRSRDHQVRAWYESQLCTPLSGAPARALMRLAEQTPGVLGSIAVTGGDPYFRVGTDVGVVFETSLPDTLAGVIREAAGPTAALAVNGGESARAPETLVAGTPDGRVRVFLRALEDRVIVANSKPLFDELVRLAESPTGSMASSNEYRFFRERYSIGQATELALLVVPDAAIRTWSSPRWRIASSRRTRALALLDDIDVRHSLASRADLPGSPPERDWTLLESVISLDGVGNSTAYGTARFMTPIAELEFDSVTPDEAQLYERWRGGYERNWSNYFDPIGIRLSKAGKTTELDVTVLPLIGSSEYRDMIEVVGGERLEGRDGDPGAPSIVHFTAALDPKSEPLQELGRELGGFTDGFGPNALAWLGDWWSLHADEGELVERLLEVDDLDDAWDEIEADLDLLPVVFQVGVARPLALAGFLTTLRGMAETSAPGLIEWNTERTDDGRPFVRVASSALSGDEMAILYATTPKALIVSFSREALVDALDRWNPPEDSAYEPPADDAPTPWLGQSVGFEFTPTALLYLGLLEGGDPRTLARDASWSNLPALEAMRRLAPDEDPVEAHFDHYGERLRCAGGGEYVWDAEWQRMASTVYGHPDAPQEAEPLPPLLRHMQRLRFGLTFEPELDGLRARSAVDRRE
ncbi:MAG: hypothetical protein AAFZ65_03435 [Planctomycetota bacterium]